MIIVSQDKKSIYNFDNIKSIDIVKNGIYITDDILMDEGAEIGEYATEERAKKILEEVIKCYANTEQYKCLSSMPNCATEEKVNVLNELAENSFVYEMPKE